MGRRRPGPTPWLAAMVMALACAGLLPTAAAAAKAKVVVRGPSTHKTVAITIDDGYDAKRCREMYNTLVEFGVPATFLPNAVHVQESPEVWRLIAKRFEIANHTTHHPSLPSLSTRRIRDEITSDERIIESITGTEMTKILRPPYGAYDDKVLREAGKLGYDVIALWDVTSADTAKDPPDRKVAQNMLRGHPGAIILMHCGPEVTPRVLPIVIARYACEGFRFASLSQLLAGEAGTKAKATCPPPHLPPPEHKKKRPPLADSLLANEWQLVDVASGETMSPVEPGDTFTLGFAGRTASGTVGCETFTARLRVKQDGSVKFRKADRVDDACASPVPSEATSRLDLLLSAVGYRLDGESLVFVGRDGNDLLRYDPLLPSGLVGDWTVSSIADAAGVLQPVDPSAPLTVMFTSDGRLEGSTACDTYSATYLEADGTLSIEGIATGAAPCEEPLATRQTAFLAALDAVASSSLSESSLQLLDAEGAVLLSLVATPPPTPSPSASPIA